MCGFGNPVPESEIEMILRFQQVNRLHEFGQKFFANYEGVSLMVKQMPEDPDKCGRFRDHLAIIAESAEVRVKAIEMRQAMLNLIEDASCIVNNIVDVQDKQEVFRKQSLQILEDQVIEMEEKFLRLGLTEEQEEELIELSEKGVCLSNQSFQEQKILNQRLSDEITSIENKLVELMTRLEKEECREAAEAQPVETDSGADACFF
jgi:hypothetical protein